MARDRPSVVRLKIGFPACQESAASLGLKAHDAAHDGDVASFDSNVARGKSAPTLRIRQL